MRTLFVFNGCLCMIYGKKNVLDAAKERIAYTLSEFDNVYVSFSGGKDSGVLLNLMLMVANEVGYQGTLGVFHIDYEAQYQATTDYVDSVFSTLPDHIKKYRCCVPFKAATCTSMFETYWRPWEEEKKALWVRPLPTECLSRDSFDFFNNEISDYAFQERFSLWCHEKNAAQKTCVLVGIRAQESLNRWRTIVSDRNVHKYKKTPWTTKVYENVFNAYPIYDWKTEDIWGANAKFGWSYNRLYDLMHYAGVPLHAMRVSSPFHAYATSTLKLYQVIDPAVWSRMVSRVNGVNFTALYGGTKAMGWKEITKPPNFTWQQYMEFLLSTLPEETAANYRAKLEASKKSWRVGGGCDPKTIEQLEEEGAPIRRTGRNTNHGRGDKELIQFDDYVDDTSVDDFRRVPSYKRMCICIMKNDHVCKYMGFAPNKRESERRAKALEKYKDL